MGHPMRQQTFSTEARILVFLNVSFKNSFPFLHSPKRSCSLIQHRDAPAQILLLIVIHAIIVAVDIVVIIAVVTVEVIKFGQAAFAESEGNRPAPFRLEKEQITESCFTHSLSLRPEIAGLRL